MGLEARSDSLQLCGSPSRRLLRTLARVRATFAEPLAHLIRRRVDGREHDQRRAVMHAAHQSHQPVEGGLVQTLGRRFLGKEKPPAKGFFYWKSECILKRKCLFQPALAPFFDPTLLSLCLSFSF